MTRVLAVDDEEQNLVLTQRVAEELGFATHTLSDAQRFMTTFVRFKPDIVVIDIVMPNMDGIEIIQWLKDVDYSGSLISCPALVTTNDLRTFWQRSIAECSSADWRSHGGLQS
jgi:CheY-like chemotaxis protein